MADYMPESPGRLHSVISTSRLRDITGLRFPYQERDFQDFTTAGTAAEPEQRHRSARVPGPKAAAARTIH